MDWSLATGSLQNLLSSFFYLLSIPCPYLHTHTHTHTHTLLLYFSLNCTLLENWFLMNRLSLLILHFLPHFMWAIVKSILLCVPKGYIVHIMSGHALLQGIFLNPGIKPMCPALQVDSSPAELPGKPRVICIYYIIIKYQIIVLT